MTNIGCVSDLGEYEMTTFERVFQKVAYLAILLFLVFMVYFFYLLFVPFQDPEIVTPMPVSPKVVARGEQLTFQIDINKRKDYPVEGSRTIECDDGNQVTLTNVSSNAPLGKRVITSAPITIPEKTSLSMCRLIVVVRYQVSPLKTVHQTYETEKFKVVESRSNNI